MTERIAELLTEEKPRMLRETYGKPEWQGITDDQRVDIVDAAIAWAIEKSIVQPWYFKNESHVSGATHIRRDRIRQERSLKTDREVPLFEDFEAVDVDAPGGDQDELAHMLSSRELSRSALDCLAELTEKQEQILRLKADAADAGTQMGERTIAKTLGLSGRDEVRRELYQIEEKIKQFAVVLQAGRLCGKRAASIQGHLAGTANSDDVRRAQAHLDTCESCSRAYSTTRHRLGREVAALAPLPALLAGTSHHRLPDVLSWRFWRLDALRDVVVGLVSRQPASADLVSSAGASASNIAFGAKIAVGVCLVAGGAGVCDQVAGTGVLHHRPTKVAQRAPKPVHHTRATAATPTRVRSASTRPATALTPSPSRVRTTSTTTSSRSRRATPVAVASTAVAKAASAPAPDLSPNAVGAGFEAKNPTATAASATTHPQATSRGGFETAAGTPQTPSPSTEARALPARDFNTTGFESGTP